MPHKRERETENLLLWFPEIFVHKIGKIMYTTKAHFMELKNVGIPKYTKTNVCYAICPQSELFSKESPHNLARYA